MSLIALALFLLSLGPLQVEYVDHVDADNHHDAAAALACHDGVPTLYATPAISFEDWVHELAHAHHCRTTGSLYIPMPDHPRPATFIEAHRATGASWYCWSGGAEWTGDLTAETRLADAEYYACEVVRTGRLR